MSYLRRRKTRKQTMNEVLKKGILKRNKRKQRSNEKKKTPEKYKRLNKENNVKKEYSKLIRNKIVFS